MPALKFTIPANIQQDVIDALRDKFQAPEATQDQLIEMMEAELKEDLKQTYLEYMRSKKYDASF
jgi:hypothetical protein